MFDIYLAGIVGGIAGGIAVGIFNPDAFSDKGSDQLFELVFGLVVVFVWVFIESLFLSSTGTTPGKWLFKTRLIPPSGDKPDYSTALSRSFKVWWRGLGIGFPLASLITLIVAHGNLTKNGTTTWDRDDGFTVVHERIGPLRVIVAAHPFPGLLTAGHRRKRGQCLTIHSSRRRYAARLNSSVRRLPKPQYVVFA